MRNIAQLASGKMEIVRLFSLSLAFLLILSLSSSFPSARADEEASSQKASTQLGELYYREAHRIIEEAVGRSGAPLGNSTVPDSAPTSAATASAYDALKRAAHYGHPAAQHELATALWHGVFFDLIVPMEPGR
jgi:hypothetical protein